MLFISYLIIFAAFISQLVCSAPCTCPQQTATAGADNSTETSNGSYNSQRPLVKFPGRGGSGGSPFDDLKIFKRLKVVGISSIDIGFSTQINGIQVTYLLSNKKLYKAPVHGNFSTEFTRYTIKLDTASNEYISKVEVQTNGFYVDQLKITTSVEGYQHRVYGPFGPEMRLNYVAEGYILGFHGRAGDDLDNIGVYALKMLKKSNLYGIGARGPFAYPFDDGVDWPVPPVVGISKLYIWHGGFLNALQVEYLLLDGSTRLGKKHGGQQETGNLTLVTLGKGEQIIQISGKTDRSYYTYLDQMSFVTRNQRGGACTCYGPFGVTGDNYFEFSGNIYGFFGTLNINVYGLGAYYI